MNKVIVIFILSATNFVAIANNNIDANCGHKAISLIKDAWTAYPRNVSHPIGDSDKSIQLLLKSLKDSPSCRRGLRLISGLYSELHKIERAKKYNDQLLEKYPDDKVGWSLKSDFLVYDNEYGQAIKIHENLIDQYGGGNGSSYYSIARIYALDNHVDLSLKYLEKAMAIRPGWGNEANAQADIAFDIVIKDDRFWSLPHSAQ